MSFSRFTRTALLRCAAVLTLAMPCSLALGQQHSPSYYYDPQPLAPGEHLLNLGLSLTLLPEPNVEQEIPAPAIDLQAKYGLSNVFTAYGSLSTNIFTNVMLVGVQAGHSFGNWNVSAGDAFAFFAGFLSVEGQFNNNSAAAIANMPAVRIGRRIGQTAISLSAYGTFLLHADMNVASVRQRGIELTFNDLYFTLAFEQPFFASVLVSSGVRVIYSRTPYQSWMLYNTFDQFLMLPEFFFAFQL